MNNAVPRILAGTCAASGVTLFAHHLLTPPAGDCDCVTYSSFVFLTAIFLCIAAQDPPRVLQDMHGFVAGVLHFLLALFLLEVSKILWDHVECLVTSVLPSLCRRHLMADKDSGVLWIFCSFGDAVFFTVLVYLLAVAVLFVVLRRYILADT